MEKKYIIYGVVLAVLIVGIVVYFNSRKKKASALDLGFDDKQTDEQKLNRIITDQSFPIQFGARSERVLQIQTYLKNKGATFPKFGLDGIWGAETEENVLKFLGTKTVSKDFFIKEKIYLL